MRHLKSYTSGVIPTYVVVSIKSARFKCQPSIPMKSFVSIRCTPFMEIDDKGEEIVQRYES
jgi:hypothetical protein